MGRAIDAPNINDLVKNLNEALARVDKISKAVVITEVKTVLRLYYECQRTMEVINTIMAEGIPVADLAAAMAASYTYADPDAQLEKYMTLKTTHMPAFIVAMQADKYACDLGVKSFEPPELEVSEQTTLTPLIAAIVLAFD